MAELDQLNVSTRRYIRDNPALVDNWSQNDPLIAYLKQTLKVNYTGGQYIQEGYTTGGLVGSSYLKGKEFNITEVQVEQAKQFPIKYFEVNVTLSQEDVEVLNKGPLAVFNLLDSRMTTAYQTMGVHMAIGQYLNGINAGYTPNFNGLAEMINDGTNVSWDNSTYASYGGITRNAGQTQTTLNGNLTNVNGPILFPQLESSYGKAEYGSIQPNLGVTTVIGYSYIKNKFQTQQRFNDTQDPAIGFNGLKFNAATLIKSRYCPGSDIVSTTTTSNAEAVKYLKEMSGNVVTTYPALAVSSSETLFWLNAREPYLNFYVSDSAKFGFGFTGFKPAQANTKVAGQILAACAITGEPRYHSQVLGITS